LTFNAPRYIVVTQYSIRINDRWRICFAWKEGDAIDVEITDYH